MSADNLTFAPAAKIHLTDRPPVACASCNGQYPDRRHVDFSAGYEGMTLPPEAQAHIAGAKHVHVDDLIICEECLTSAAAALGLGDTSIAEGERDDAVEAAVEMSERLRGAVAYIKTLENAASQRETLEEALKPKRATRRAS
jgi:hypothetical protein